MPGVTGLRARMLTRQAQSVKGSTSSLYSPAAKFTIGVMLNGTGLTMGTGWLSDIWTGVCTPSMYAPKRHSPEPKGSFSESYRAKTSTA